MEYKRYRQVYIFLFLVFSINAQAFSEIPTLNLDSVNNILSKLEKVEPKDSAWVHQYYDINRYAYHELKTTHPRLALSYMHNVLYHADIAVSYPFLLGHMNKNLGNGYYRLQMTDSAEYFLLSALRFYESYDPDSVENEDYRTSLGSVYYKLGCINSNLKYNYSDAEYFLRKAITLCEQIDSKINSKRLAIWYYELGTVCSYRDDEEMALHYFAESKRVLDAAKIEYQSLRNSLEVSVANVYLETGKYNDAVMVFQNLIDKAKQNNGNNSSTNLYYNNLGLALNGLELYQSAIEAFKTSLLSSETLDCHLLTLTNIGQAYWRLGQADSAFFYFDKGIDFTSGCFSQGHELILNAYLLPIEAYIECQEFAKAANLSRHCLKEFLVARKGGDTGDSLNYNNLYDSEAAIDVLFANSIAELNLSNSPSELNKTLQKFILLDSLVEYERSYLHTETSKLMKGNQIKNLYGYTLMCVDRLLTFGATVSMNIPYSVIEKSRARLLQENFVSSRGTSSSNLNPLITTDDELYQEERELLNELYNNERLGEDGEKAAKEIKAKLFKVRSRQKEIKEHLKNQHSEYYRLKYSASTGSIEQLCAMAKKHEIGVLNYFMGPDNAFVLLIAPDGNVSFHNLGHPKLLNEMVKKLYFLLADGVQLDKKEMQYEEFCKWSHKLYLELIPSGFNKRIPSKLIVIPDGILGAFPFELLLTEQVVSNKMDYRSLPYLIKNTEVQYFYSANVMLQKSRQPLRQQKSKPLAFIFNDEPVVVEGKRYPPLPGAKREMEGIMAIYPSSQVHTLGHDCSERAFKEEVTHFDILHLALHGVADTTSAYNSALIFPEGGNTTEDGILYNHEISSMIGLPSLVILSACESGLGKLESSEGILSVGRAFINGGSDNVILSTWQVNDALSGNLFKSFYQYYAHNESSVKALHLAKLEFIQKADEYSAFPGYWGAYIHVASGMSKKTIWPWHLIGLFASLILLSFFVYRRKAIVYKSLSGKA